MIHAESLAAVCGGVTSDKSASDRKRNAAQSGSFAKTLFAEGEIVGAELAATTRICGAHLVTRHLSPVTCHVIAHTKIPSAGNFANVCVIPHDAEAFARAIYAELHRCDEAGAEWIVVEAPPDLPEWSAIADRLRRAAGEFRSGAARIYFCNFQRSESVRNRRSGKKPGGAWSSGN